MQQHYFLSGVALAGIGVEARYATEKKLADAKVMADGKSDGKSSRPAAATQLAPLAEKS